MINIAKLNQKMRQKDIELYLEHLDKWKTIPQDEACILLLYICKDSIGLRKTLKIMHSVGIDSL